MAAYRLFIKRSAAKELETLSGKKVRQRIVQRIRALADEPRSEGSEKLAGAADRFRLRQGSFRVIYLIDDLRREVTVFKIGHRKSVYR